MFKRLYGLLRSADSDYPRIVPPSAHQISQRDLSKGALRVIEQLSEKGFEAYLVGGGVRDLLLGDHPKDFDVATDATPEEIKKVFRNARIIGRRFQIVHVRFGREIIEVTTFRGSPKNAKTGHEHTQSDKGILLRDNVYGDIESDALRRDFTVNALYYSPHDESILDYTNGVKDLSNRQLRIIGDPDARYKEDPVRMLRAVRFSARLGFTLTPETEEPIHQHADYLADIPPARLFEEVLKLILCSYATAVLTMLREFGLLQYLFPGTDGLMANPHSYYHKLVFAMTTNTDKRLRTGKRVSPAFIYAAMLWPPLHAKMRELRDEQKFSAQDALQMAAQSVIEQQLRFTSIPKRFLIPMREIWSLQHRLLRRDGKRAYLMMEHPRFRAAYDFLLLREEAGEKLEGLGLWWTRFQDANEEQRSEMLTDLPKPPSRRKRSPRRRKPKEQSSTND